MINWRYQSRDPKALRSLAKELAEDLKEVLVDLGEGYECPRAAALQEALDAYICPPEEREKAIASIQRGRGKKARA